jgi:hypothetical protein
MAITARFALTVIPVAFLTIRFTSALNYTLYLTLYYPSISLLKCVCITILTNVTHGAGIPRDWSGWVRRHLPYSGEQSCPGVKMYQRQITKYWHDTAFPRHTVNLKLCTVGCLPNTKKNKHLGKLLYYISRLAAICIAAILLACIKFTVMTYSENGDLEVLNMITTN